MHETRRPAVRWWRGQDLNLRPSGYEPDELPDCSTPRREQTRYHLPNGLRPSRPGKPAQGTELLRSAAGTLRRIDQAGGRPGPAEKRRAGRTWRRQWIRPAPWWWGWRPAPWWWGWTPEP